MKRLLLYPFILFLNIIRKNILKCVWTLLCLTGFYFSSYYKDDLHLKKTADYIVKDTKGYNYFFKDSNSTDNTVYSKLFSKTPLKNNTYYYTEMQGGFIIFRVIAWFSLVVVVLCTIIGIGDSDSGWEFNDCIKESLSFLISCQMEDGKFYYLALGRLLIVSDRQINNCYDNIADQLHISSITQILNCPKFETKHDRRAKALDKLV